MRMVLCATYITTGLPIPQQAGVIHSNHVNTFLLYVAVMNDLLFDSARLHHGRSTVPSVMCTSQALLVKPVQVLRSRQRVSLEEHLVVCRASGFSIVQ